MVGMHSSQPVAARFVPASMVPVYRPARRRRLAAAALLVINGQPGVPQNTHTTAVVLVQCGEQTTASSANTRPR
jgi:hypothetical protein